MQPTEDVVNEDTIQQRLMALEDERHIIDTLYQYCHAFDYGRRDELQDCFTDDAGWYWTAKDAAMQEGLRSQGFTMVGTFDHPLDMDDDPTGAAGHQQLGMMVSATTGPPQGWTKHSMSNIRVTINGDDAITASYFVVVDASKRTTGGYIMAFGRYLDELVRCPDGRWRIRRRDCHFEMSFYESPVDAAL